MEDCVYSSQTSNSVSMNWQPSQKNSRYFTVPQRCDLELCRMPDWHLLHSYRDRFSSSSFADSESEEEMTKRAAGRELMGPPPVPLKIWRGGGAYRGVGRDHGPPAFAERRHSQPMMPPGPAFRRPHFSHSSSDEEVFLEPLPMEHRGPPLPFTRHPPPFPGDVDVFVPPPPPHHPAHNQCHDPYFQHQHPRERARLSEEVTGFSERPQIRERYHSVPVGGRDLPRGRDPSRGHDPFRGFDPSRGHLVASSRHVEAPPAQNCPPHPLSGGSSDEGSGCRVMSGSDEFEYLYRYGYRDRQGLSRRGRVNSGTSSGSDNSSSYRQATWRRGGTTTARGREQETNRGGFVAGRGSADKWNVKRNVPGQKELKHQSLPPPKPANALHMQQIHRGFHSLASLETRRQALDLSEMSMAEKLRRFMLFVRHENSARINDIQTIENAITGCHLDLKTLYEAEDVGVYQGRHTFSGKLTLSGIFLARAVGQVKKELKHECYKLALQVLKTKNVPEILKQHDIGIKAIRAKFEECSAADTDSNVSDAVVNLASAAPIAVAMETVATMEERWIDFVNFLNGLNPDMGNTISRIELAISGSRCGLERQYEDVSMVDPFQGKPGFQGSLTIGGVLQAQGQGSKKKEAKQKTYDIAFERFIKLDVTEVMKGVEPQSLEEFKKEGKAFNFVVKEICTPEHIKKFEFFIDRIKDSSVREGPITLLDLTANQLQLLITCMYKRVEDAEVRCLCQLFVGDILISEGEGRHKKEAQADAYSKAYEMLISTPLETIITESHRLNKEELEGADVRDVVVKGQMKKEESNLPRLRNQFQKAEEALSEKKSEDMVVVEHQDWIHDRKRHAFCIMQNSALMNVMLLKWCTEVETGFFTCCVHLQGEDLGMAKAHSRQQARNLAAADVLFRMYETNPVLRIISTDPSSSWMSRAQLMEKMKEMPPSQFEEVDAEWEEYLNKKALSRSESEEGDDRAELTEEEKEEKKTERRLRVVALKVVEEFQQRGDILDELVFAPDLPLSVRRFLPASVARMGLRSMQCQKDGKIYIAVQFRVRVDKIVEAMTERGVTKTRRFLLVEDRSELPCHADIAAEIEAARTFTRQDRMAARIAPKAAADKESCDAAVGNSLNGSLFEDTMEGFVTAQSSMLANVNASPQPPQVQSTPQTTPPKQGTSPKMQTTPAEKVYAKFARAMMASGIGQTLVPMESSTPVSNILVNPPASDNISSNSSIPVIKNILISPPKGGNLSVTLSSPVKNLSIATSTSSSSSFPQPDFSSAVSPSKGGKQSPLSPSQSGPTCGTLSLNGTGVSSQHTHSHSSMDSGSSLQQSKSAAISGCRQTSQRWTNQQAAPPAGRTPGKPMVSQSSVAAANRNEGMAASQNFTASGNSAPCSQPKCTGCLANNNPVYLDLNPGRGGCYGNQYQNHECGAWMEPAWSSTDPSAPHVIEMSPGNNSGYQDGGSEYPRSADGYSTAVYVENELPAPPAHGRRWNHYNTRV